MKTEHVNLKFLNAKEISEGVILREKFALQTKTDWRSLNKREKWSDKARKDFLEQRRDANKNFHNETVVRYMAY
jgi:hypothetical protein